MKFHLWCLALTATFAVSASLAQTPALPPVEAFGTLPTISNPAISPDGRYLAAIQVLKGRPVATIWTLEPRGSAPVVLPYQEGFIDDVRWANDHRLLVRVNLNARVFHDNVKPWYRTIVVDPDGTNPVVLFANMTSTRDINYSASKISDLALDDPDHIYMPLWSNAIRTRPDQSVVFYRVNVIYRVDVNTGSANSYVSGWTDTNEFFMDGNGNVVARVDQTKDPLTDHLLVYTPENNWREIVNADAQNAHGLDVAGLSLDGNALVIGAVAKKTGLSGLTLMSLADGKESDLYFHPVYDVSNTLPDPWTGRVVGATVTMHLERDFYFDPKLQAMQATLETTFPGLAAHAQSWDQAVTKVVVSVVGAMSPPMFYLFHTQTGQVERLGRTYPQLQSSDLGEVRVFDYKARDGLEIPAYLTLPPRKEAKNLPVVILPHGGPMARDDMSFDWESQFLANRGYAVLRPNFRGSTGYGKKFLEAGFGQWGLKMQDDVTDGVKKLIADGIADPKRICIAGGSYGGYAALAGAAFTPDLYACAAAWAPVADLRKFLETRAKDFGRDSAMISSWQHFIGDRWDDSEKLDAASPSENAAKFKAPVLLMHGEADATVRIDQSERMDRALRRAGKKVTFIRIEKETHYMQTSDTRIRWLTELEKFLKENIGN